MINPLLEAYLEFCSRKCEAFAWIHSGIVSVYTDIQTSPTGLQWFSLKRRQADGLLPARLRMQFASKRRRMLPMVMSLVDRSKYYRGLLILTGKDRIVDPRERSLILGIGAMLDFEKRFCEAAIDSLLENQYLTDEPVIFSSRELAECFLLDGIRVAFADEHIHQQESAWLEKVARANGVDDTWIQAEIRRPLDSKEKQDPLGAMAIHRYL